MSEYEDILYETRGDGVARVTINRPDKYNAFRGRTVEELIAAFQRAGWDKAVGVIVLTGMGDRAFCTGADLDEQEQFLKKRADYWKWMGSFIEAHDRLEKR